jgi:heme/copper-type cytochrome/quinol oxidase subunit 2
MAHQAAQPRAEPHRAPHDAGDRLTVIPVLILVIIAIPSFRLIYYEDKPRDADLTVKVTGHHGMGIFTRTRTTSTFQLHHPG